MIFRYDKHEKGKGKEVKNSHVKVGQIMARARTSIPTPKSMTPIRLIARSLNAGHISRRRSSLPKEATVTYVVDSMAMQDTLK